MGTVHCLAPLIMSCTVCVVCVPLASASMVRVCVRLVLVGVCAVTVRCVLPRGGVRGVSPLWACVRCVCLLHLWSLLQVGGCVFPPRSVCVSAAGGRVLLGHLQALALLVLRPEPPQLGAPVLPPVEGDGRAVRHQTELPGRPVTPPFLCSNQEEGPAHLKGGAAAAEVAVGHPEGLLAPANTRRSHPEHGLHPYGELPPGPGTFHSFHLHFQNCKKKK